jgi:ectoine hydroxylase-related dioxygenase (phytanoyl-CoA dioxygenase family)
MAPTATEAVATWAIPRKGTYIPGLPTKEANTPVEVKPSPEEIACGRFTDANIKLFLSGMHRDGVVILKDVIDPAHLDKINEFMVADTEIQLKKEGLHHNFDVENIQQGPPLAPEDYFFDDVYLNKLLFHAVTLYLGTGAGFNLISGNNALPNGVKRQPVHADAMSAHPTCPYYAVANIYTVDASPVNASTEIWLGTQNFNVEAQTPTNIRGATRIRDDYLEEQMKTRPGFQPTIKKGSVLFRDMRMWHAGMPNQTDQQRFMIALGFSAGWWHGKARFRVPAGTGVYERFMHGMKGTGVVPWMAEISQEDYNELRDAADFTGNEKKTYEGETY